MLLTPFLYTGNVVTSFSLHGTSNRVRYEEHIYILTTAFMLSYLRFVSLSASVCCSWHSFASHSSWRALHLAESLPPSPNLSGVGSKGLGRAEPAGTLCTYPTPPAHSPPASLITMRNTSSSAALTIVPRSFPPRSCADRHKHTTLLTPQAK